MAAYEYHGEEEAKAVEAKKQDFAELLKKQFTINDMFNKYSDYDYSTSPNIPKEVDFDQLKQQRDTFGRPVPYVLPNPYNTPSGDKYPPYVEPMPQERGIDWERELGDVLRRFQEQQQREQEEGINQERRRQTDIERLFGGSKNLKKEEKKELLKNAFINLIRDKINFDDDSNLVDENGNVVSSIGQFGLMFIRILNSVLESKKSAEQNEKDLKDLLKN